MDNGGYTETELARIRAAIFAGNVVIIVLGVVMLLAAIPLFHHWKLVIPGLAALFVGVVTACVGITRMRDPNINKNPDTTVNPPPWGGMIN